MDCILQQAICVRGVVEFLPPAPALGEEGEIGKKEIHIMLLCVCFCAQTPTRSQLTNKTMCLFIFFFFPESRTTYKSQNSQ